MLRPRFSANGWRAIATLVAAALISCLLAPKAEAQDLTSYTVATFQEWMHKYANATPDFKPGDVLTAKDLERIRPFMPPGYLEQLNFPEFKMEVIAPVSHRPRKDFVNCTEKYQSQVRLRGDGALENFVCGQPFPDSSMSPNDPSSGIKAAWNFEYRWQNYGTMIPFAPVTWVRFGGDHKGYTPPLEGPPSDWMSGLNFTYTVPQQLAEFYGGGGTFQRTLQGFNQRVYLTHLAQLADKGGTLPVPGAEDFEFKEFTGFYAPFDISGTVFIVYRYLDPYRADDGWAYIPNLRRVRRISAEVKSDSLLGTDHTIEDFFSFSGRPLDWNWKFLGWKDVLCVMDSKYDYTHLYGPNGIIPDDAWSLRRFAAIERTPKAPRHPYSAVVMLWDAENWDAWLEFAWDKKGKLWKTWEYQKKWSETFKGELAQINAGVHTTSFQSVQVSDLQNQRGTLLLTFGGYPDASPDRITQLYDINKLEEMHR